MTEQRGSRTDGVLNDDVDCEDNSKRRSPAEAMERAARLDRKQVKAELPLAYACHRLGIHLDLYTGRASCPFHDDRDPSFGLWMGDDGIERFSCSSLRDQGRCLRPDLRGAGLVVCGGTGMGGGSARRVAPRTCRSRTGQAGPAEVMDGAGSGALRAATRGGDERPTVGWASCRDRRVRF